MQRFPMLVVASTMILTLAGCSGEGKYVPVTGKLQFGGQPAEGAQVTLVPASVSLNEPSPLPTGQVEADGTYKLSTYDPVRRKSYAGVPPGEYKVTISWIPPLHVGESVDTKKRPKDKLAGKYLDPAKSPYPVVVKEPGTEIAPIELKVSKRN